MQSAFEALSHPIRRDIVKLLRRRAMSAGEIAERFPVAKATLSGHFTVLKNADLISAERRGTTIIYRLNLSVAEDMMAAVLDLFGAGQNAAKEMPDDEPAQRTRNLKGS
jgi:DNA-binding transcriptional ArsR family regulator